MVTERQTVCISLTRLIRHRKDAPPARASARLIKSASFLPEGDILGWQMAVPKSGIVKMSAFGSGSITEQDLRWIFETEAVTGSSVNDKLPPNAALLYELLLPVTGSRKLGRMGFAGQNRENEREGYANVKWPVAFFGQFNELIRALRDEGAVLKFTAGSASEDEIRECEENYRKDPAEGMNMREYLGTPVKVRMLLRMPSPPTTRLKAILDGDINGIRLHSIGDIQEKNCRDVWEDPLSGAAVLPAMAARILMLEPLIFNRDIFGVKTCEERIKPVPAEHKNSTGKRTVKIGRATDTSGASRVITIGNRDLQRHWQIIGQTGTGKSTLLVTAITDAIKDGYGLTFFDPHGTTIDNVIRSIPEESAKRVRVVRIGDDDHPVPISMWDSEDPEVEERKISDLCQLFGDIFNPKSGEVYVGPRWERWFTTFTKAAIALFGQNASFESIITLSANRSATKRAAEMLKQKYPALSSTLLEEYCNNKSNDFNDLVNWCVSKFQRIISVSQLRKTLGAGRNALDFKTTIDSDTVTLIDLATPAIGTPAARIVGTFLLMQLWNAVMTRKKRDMTHLVFIDEAHLFQTNPLPQMLAESRKFGLGIIMAHQHCGQLSHEVMDALDANSANFTAFRLSAKDAAMAALRFDDERAASYLVKLDAFNALTTLSVDGKQTKPFTLKVSRVHQGKDAGRIAAGIEEKSIKELVEPYKKYRALTSEEIMARIMDGKVLTPSKDDNNCKTLTDQLFPFGAFNNNFLIGEFITDAVAKGLLPE